MGTRQPRLADDLTRRNDFETLCERYRGPLERAALSLTGDPDEAADLLQETLIRAFRYFHNFEIGTNFRAWALRILHNTHISRYRQRKRDQEMIAWDDVAEHAESQVEDLAGERDVEPETRLFAMMPDEEVQIALDSLPDSFRRVVELADLRDYSYAEVGQILQLPIGTVRSRLFRARQRLRDVLAPYALRNGYIRPEQLETTLPSAA